MSLLVCLVVAALRLKLVFAIWINHPLDTSGQFLAVPEASFYLSTYIMQQVNALNGQKETQRKRRLPHDANNRLLREETI
jgi:hypothetical protein